MPNLCGRRVGEVIFIRSRHKFRGVKQAFAEQASPSHTSSNLTEKEMKK